MPQLARKRIKLEKLEGNSQVGRCATYLPRKNTLLQLFALDTSGGVLRANIPTFRVTKNGVILIEGTAVALDEWNKVFGRVAYATTQKLFKFSFEDYVMKAPNAVFATAIPVGNDDELLIEIITDGVNVPSWEIYADVYEGTAPPQATAGFLTRRLKAFVTESLGVGTLSQLATTNKIPYSDKSTGEWWKSLMILESAGAIAHTVIKTGDRKLHDVPTAINAEDLTDHGFTPGSYWGEIIIPSVNGALDFWDLSEYKSGDENVSVGFVNGNGATYSGLIESLSPKLV